MYMKRILALILALLLTLSLVACGGETQPETTQPPVVTDKPETTLPNENPPDAPNTTDTPALTGGITFFQLSCGENYENILSLSAWPNEDGTLHVEFVADVKKVGDLDISAEEKILAALETSGLKELNGQDVYEDGEANGSMYICFADESYLAAGFSGKVPEAYINGYKVMEDCFRQLTAELEEYVPQPLVLNAVDPADMDILKQIYEGAGLEPLDAYAISSIEKDDTFAFMAGLSSHEGIARGVTFSPVMITSAYSLVIVTLEEGKDAAEVCSDFAASINWRKWVCVAPSEALIAQKDNMVLCLIGSDMLFAQTAAAIQAAGWTVVEELKNPDMH